jgi:hypothetical protein
MAGKKNTKTSTKKAAAAKPKKLSALDAAARVLTESGQAMNCKEMIEAMLADQHLALPQVAPHTMIWSAGRNDAVSRP